jgi:hypothetical protein
VAGDRESSFEENFENTLCLCIPSLKPSLNWRGNACLRAFQPVPQWGGTRRFLQRLAVLRDAMIDLPLVN